MKYTQKLMKIGNSVGMIIPSQVLEDMNVGVGTKIYVEHIQDKLLIEKENTRKISPEFLKVADSLADRYQEVFKELSKS